MNTNERASINVNKAQDRDASPFEIGTDAVEPPPDVITHLLPRCLLNRERRGRGTLN
jgi:hypothetical protein